jgi:predicted nuclease of predicted toxin-antitoxin system
MRLLFDQNLSPRIIDILAAEFPGSEHVHPLGLGETDDGQIWEYARVGGLTIVTRDADYANLSEMRGFPPKVIWIRRGNCSTREIVDLLQTFQWAIEELGRNSDRGVLILS